MNRDRRHNKINGLLRGKPCVIIGGGTSLSGFDFNKLDTYYTIALNHSIETYPKAKALLFGDKIFLNKTTFDIRTYRGLIFASEKCTRTPPLDKMLGQDNVYIFNDNRMSPELNCKVGLYHPTSAGLLGLNLALQMRAAPIYLLGYDYYMAGERIHYFEDYDHHKKTTSQKLEAKTLKFAYFERYKNDVINCNPKSLVKIFKFKTLAECFG